MAVEKIPLRGEFQGWLIGDVFSGPDLSVRVRITGSHHRSSVLEDLNVANVAAGRKIGFLIGPLVDYAPNGLRTHRRKREVVPRIEA